ncbi:MAG: hypothetical protein Q8L79_10385 [Methylobacter sp.]|uniref:hypothetical protein n=1 Tax=Methylobacter sp. TaxID=2051955 RepID=UPI002730103D|nr:hypothetical protein [Methylobacter sp.]MDP1665518.1 hypothetical protein [Methylobacter sp.]
MITSVSGSEANGIIKGLEHAGLRPVVVIDNGVYFVCKSYEEATHIMALLS